MVWVDFLGGLHFWQILGYKGEKRDNKERDLNYEHLFPKVLGYLKVCDIMEVGLTEFRVYIWV